MQKLCACWKTRNLPRCNFEHASALEKASDFEGGGEDIFTRGGQGDCHGASKTDWRDST